MKGFILNIAFFLLFNIVWGEQITNYGLQDGLSNMEVTDICHGDIFLWIATRDGLNRFDGKNFTSFKKDNSENSLYSNNIETLAFDSRGLLWIGYKSGGASIYNPRTDSFQHIGKFLDDYPQRVVSIYEDSDANIWLGSWEQGVYKITVELEDGILTMSSRHHLNVLTVSAIIEKPIGTMWFGTFSGIITLDFASNSWTNFANYKSNIKKIVVADFYDGGNENDLWCTTWDRGLTVINLRKNELYDFDVYNNSNENENLKSVYRIVTDNSGKFILGTWGQGLFYAEPNVDGNSKYHIKKHDKLNSSIILAILKDQYKNIWIGTDGDGLFKIDSENAIISIPKPGDTESESHVYCLSPGKNGTVWIGTKSEGFFLYDLKNKRKIASYKSTENKEFENNILSIYHDDNEILLIGHDGSGILSTDISEQPNKNLHTLNVKTRNRIDISKITSIKRDKGNRIWLGTKQSGLKYMIADSFAGENFYINSCLSLQRNRITDIENLQANKLLISTYNGLFQLNTNTLESEGHFLEDDIIYSMSPVVGGKIIWLGTSSGLSKVEFNDSLTIKEFQYANQLPKGSIRNTIIDDMNNLWFTISNRLFYIDNKSNSIKEISLVNKKQAFMAACNVIIDKEEHLVFGGNEGLVLVNPNKILSEENNGRIVFSNLQIDYNRINVGDTIYGQQILKETVPYTQKLQIPYKYKWLTFSFTEISVGNVQANYKYKLSGFSDEWYDLGSSKSITVSKLKPDDYTLLISKDGNPEEIFSLDITITPPWWETTKFYVFVLFSLIIFMSMMAFFVVRHMKRKQQKKIGLIEKKKNEELLKEKVNFFTELSHDLLTPLTLIIAPVKDLLKQREITKLSKEKLKIIQQNAHYLTDIFGNILDFKKVEIKDLVLEEKSVEIVSFLKIFITAFDYLAKSKKISLEFNSSIPSLNLIIDTVKLERIIFNLISNSLKFTNEGKKVSISLDYYRDDQQSFCLTIKDTGVGIKKEALHNVFDKFYQENKFNSNTIKGSGLGLYIVNQFVNIMGGTIDIDSLEDHGTTIKIILPIKPVEKSEQTAHIGDVKLPNESKKELTTILIVEDNPELKKYISGIFTPFYNVLTTDNGKVALDIATKELPEIVISDIMMPELDGLSFCKKLKENILTSDIMIVLLTAKTSPEEEFIGYKAGADIYIKKPFDPDILVHQIKNLLKTRSERRTHLLEQIASPNDRSIKIDRQEEFLNQSLQIIKDHIDDSDFQVDQLANEMKTSRSVLYKKFKNLVGQTPNQFIQIVRLKKAAILLAESDLNINEICYTVGFNQTHYFIKCFKAQFNKTPGQYRKLNK